MTANEYAKYTFPFLLNIVSKLPLWRIHYASHNY